MVNRLSADLERPLLHQQGNKNEFHQSRRRVSAVKRIAVLSGGLMLALVAVLAYRIIVWGPCPFALLVL